MLLGNGEADLALDANGDGLIDAADIRAASAP
jgi:hypothetical protein